MREQPPSVAELTFACEKLGLKKLFNSSGMEYRSLGMKDKLPTMTEAEALQLLSENGSLVKRPLLLTENTALVGFKLAEWEALVD